MRVILIERENLIVTLISFNFFIFILITMLLYYTIKPLQKYILLAASVYFYISISSVNTIKLCILMVYMFAVTYLGAIIISHAKGKIKAIFLGLSIVAVVVVLFVLKYAFNIFNLFNSLLHANADFSWLNFAAVIGISYYALSAIGYLIDVYWQAYGAEKNPVDVALFIFYFPQLISGPVTRFADMRDKFNKHMAIDYENIAGGMRRMAWGYFEKLVISERFGIIVSAVYGNFNNYSFVGIMGATLCYAVQLYTDFAGCMDIVMGASMLFGIELPENFKAPFFSESIQEFWQRWHITLGIWFKDYVMYPVQKSKPLQIIGKWSKKRFGKKIGKKIPFYLSMLLLWVLIGIWHGGTGYYFIASAAIPCVLLMMSDFCQPFFKKSVQVLRINTECESWHWVRRIRTLLLICVCWIVVCSNGIRNAISIFNHMFLNPWNYTSFVNAMEVLGLTSLDIVLMLVGIVVLYLADRCIYQGTTIFKKMDSQNFWVRIMVIYAEVITILLQGMVGSSVFIYFQF